MARPWKGCGGADSLEAELTCPICLGLYRDPVSLNCGHSFCRQCIYGKLHYSGRCSCPTCRAYVENTNLRRNFQLDSIVKAFQATTDKAKQNKRSKEWNASAVPCEYCLDGPEPAVKTCLVCEASLCQVHLSKHDAKGFQQEHILVELGAGSAEERRCPEHGKLLECYCLWEDKCICVLCSIAGAHRGHEVITMKEEREKKLVQISDPIAELQKCKSDLVTVLEELQERRNQIKTNTRTVISELQELFENTKTELVKKEKMILSDIQSNEKAELAVVDQVRKKMEQKRDQAEQNLQALQKIKEQPDVFLFLKDLKLVTDRIANLDLSTETVHVEGVQLDQSMIAQFHTLREKLMLQLDLVLQDVRGKLTNKMERSSEASATDTSPESGEQSPGAALDVFDDDDDEDYLFS